MYEKPSGPTYEDGVPYDGSAIDRPVDPDAAEIVDRYVTNGRFTVSGEPEARKLGSYIELMAGLDPESPVDQHIVELAEHIPAQFHAQVDTAALAEAIEELRTLRQAPPTEV